MKQLLNNFACGSKFDALGIKNTLVFLTRLTSAGILLTCLSLPNLSGAATEKTDAATSTVTVIFKQLNVPVQAKFNKINAQIAYDPANPSAAKATVEIDIASFDLGDPDYNKEVLKKEWFNAAQFPKAVFTSSAITPGAAGKLTVSGKLVIKGKMVNVSFPLAVKQQSDSQVFDGAIPIRRTVFNIGDGEWKDTSVVADEVTIKFHIVNR